MRTRNAGVKFAALVAIIAALLALTATAAFAGTGPTLGVTDLQTKIDDAGGSMHGHLETVLKGSTISSIAVDVLAVTTGYGSGPADMSSLILFQATGPEIDKIGGIASGMSGSPIYVDDGGTDKLVGALSYGDIFTTGGIGLATPIEAMVKIQDYYAVASDFRALSSPVYVDGAVKNRVMIVDDPAAVKSAPPGTVVASPMSAAFIGGLNPKSRMYKAYAKVLESRGVGVVPLAGGLSSKISTYSAGFEPGSSVAVLAARGDMWVGGVGTVTYTDADEVVGFGHPAFWEGESGLYLCNAWVDGVWPSTLEAYKLARPAAVRGTLVEDRLAGIMGVDGVTPDETPITAKATNLATGDVATSAVQLPRRVANSSNGLYFGLAAMGAYTAGGRVFDASFNPGSAVTTTTVTVSDGADTYVLVRRNMFSDRVDISMAAVWDVNDMVSSFEGANANGIAHADIISVDLETEFSASRREADIVGVDVADGLRAGDNTVTVSFLQYGNPETQTINAKLTIPAGTPLTGELSVYPSNVGPDDSEFSSELFSESDPSNSGGSTVDRRSVRDVVDGLNGTPDNSTIGISFQPAIMTADSGEETDEPSAPAEEFDAIESTHATEWVVSGGAKKIAPALDVFLDRPGTLAYGTGTVVFGELLGVEGKGTVTISGLGSTTETVTVSDGTFFLLTPALYSKKTLTVTFLGNDSALPVQTTFVINVAAKTTLSTSKRSVRLRSAVTLTAKVLPKTAGGKVSFQRWNGFMWATIKTFTLPSTGVVSYSYKPTKRGTLKVRARFLGSSTNSAKSSSSVSIKVY